MQGDEAQRGGEQEGDEEEEEESADTEVENEGDAGFIDDAGGLGHTADMVYRVWGWRDR